MPATLNIGGYLNALSNPSSGGKDWDDEMIKEWTTDPNRGDKQHAKVKDGKFYYPIWKQETEVAQDKIQTQIDQYTNPNSNYYKSIGKQIRNQITGAFSPNSLLALTAAMGGSPSQAAEQMKAMEGRIGDTTSNLMNQYYLGASGQANSLLNTYAGLSQFQEQQRHQLEQYKDQERKGLFSDIAGTVGQVAGYVFAPATGGASLVASSFLGSGGSNQNTPLNQNYNMTNGQGFFGMYQNRYGKSPGMGGY